jgi:iron complex outermembrane recepter protein
MARSVSPRQESIPAVKLDLDQNHRCWRSFHSITLACALLVSAALPALARDGSLPPPAQYAVLEGVVTDALGAVVPGAGVSLETRGGQIIASAISDASGHYRLEVHGQLAPDYRERVTAQGFRTVIEENLSLPDGAKRVNDVHLSIGATSETVNVTASESTGNGEIATVAQAGILGTISENDLPYSVSSYTSQLVLDQQSQTESDVLRNEVGIQEGNGRYSEDQYMTLRGFVLDPGQSLLNGISGLVDSRSPSIENVERIEIFKGPSSFLNGASAYGAVGGTVNMVTKRAGAAPYYRFDGGYSADTEKEGHLDMGRRFLPRSALGVRLTLGGRLGDTPIGNQEENVGAAGLGVDFRGEKLHASVDVSDQARSMLAFRDALYVFPGFAIPAAPKMTSNIFDHSSSYTHHEQVVLAQGDYALNSHLDAFGSYGYAHELESYVGPGLTYLEDAQGDVTAQDLPFTTGLHSNVGRVGVRGTFQTGAIRHNITLDGDLLNIRAGYFDEFGDSYETNMYHPVPLAPLVERISGLKDIPDTNLNRNSSVALADVVTALHDKLIVIGGLRGQWIGVKEFGTVSRGAANMPDFEPCTSACSYSQGVASPSIAAMYHLSQGLSIYGNYIQDLQQGPSAPAGAANQNQVFSPYVANQKEIGAKYEHGPLQASLAVFQISEPNGVLNPTTNVFAITGEQRNRGLEFAVEGNVAPDFRVGGGISFLDARQMGTGDPTTEGKRAEGIPGTESTVNAEWTAPHLKSLNFDARLTASSGQWVDTAETQNIPAWARLDVGGRYEFETKLPLTIRVNVDNVTGANYFESGLLGLSYTGPRAVRISAGLRF